MAGIFIPQAAAQAALSTSASTLLTAPALSSSQSTGDATAQLTEITLCNTTSSAATAIIGIGGVAAANQLINTTIQGGDTLVLSGLKTLLGADATLQGESGTASAITATVSWGTVQ